MIKKISDLFYVKNQEERVRSLGIVKKIKKGITKKVNRITKNASERVAIYNPIYDFREERRQYFCRKTICDNRGVV